MAAHIDAAADEHDSGDDARQGPSRETATMTARREALELPLDRRRARLGRGAIEVSCRAYDRGDGMWSNRLVEAIVDRLADGPPSWGPGAALVDGFCPGRPIEEVRREHRRLFTAVSWEFCSRLGIGPSRITDRVLNDGRIPLAAYGSAWSFKPPHADRDAALFSHLYGPVRGFVGGEVLLIDARSYLADRGLPFASTFTWSVEPTPGSKPVLLGQHVQAALADNGLTLGVLGSTEVLFVNNTPSAGILHGATPVTVTDERSFVRQYHRCAANGELR